MSSGDSDLSPGSRRHFLQALRRVLRPIVRLMIRNGIRYDEFVDVARSAYVESAINGGLGDIKHPTREQIAWITGIDWQRIDHYIQNRSAWSTDDGICARFAAAVLHKWHTDQRYLGTDGTPVELEFNRGVGLSFQDLVAEVDANVDATLLLEELTEAGSVCHSNHGRLRMVTRSFNLPDDSLAAIDHFGAALAALSETLEYNFNPANADKRRLERAVFADRGMSADLLSRFQEFARERAALLLNDIDDWFANFADMQADSPEKRVKAGIHVFMYIEPTPDRRLLSNLIQRQHNRSRL
ncbi:MAG: DUF6502 family protein [Steroidobacteraceae bacterium]